MSNQNQDTRNPEEIESDIEEHRERLDRTLHELEERISPRRLVDTTLEYVRGGGANEFASNLSETIKRNPTPFLLTSVGLGWLILSQRNANNRSYHDDSDIYGYEDGKHYPMTTRTAPTSVPGEESTRVPPTTSVPSSTSVPPTTGTAATTTRVPPAAYATTPVGEEDHDDHRGNQGKGRMSGAKEKAQHMSSSVKGRAQGMSSNMKGRAQDMSSSVRGRAQSMSSSMRDGTARMKSGSRSAMQGASYRAQSAGQQTTQFIQEHPLVTAALGVAIGAAIGSLLPSTRTEDERLGGLRDKAVNRAAEEGEHYADQARARVHEKAEQAERDAPASGSSSSPGASSSTTSSSGTGTSGTSGTGSSTGSSSTTGSTGAGSSSTGAAGAPGTTRSPGISDSPSTGNTTTPGSAPSRPSDRGTSESDLTSGNKPPRGEGL